MKHRLQNVVVALLIVVSAISVVYTSHTARHLFNDWQVLQKEEYRLDEEWGRLLIEQSTWAAQDRVETLAGERLNMGAPGKDSTQLVMVDGKAEG